MERKIFWLTFTILGLAADFFLPLWWALGATIPIAVLSWWIAYRLNWLTNEQLLSRIFSDLRFRASLA